jgi:hypothetical protein
MIVTCWHSYPLFFVYSVLLFMMIIFATTKFLHYCSYYIDNTVHIWEGKVKVNRLVTVFTELTLGNSRDLTQPSKSPRPPQPVQPSVIEWVGFSDQNDFALFLLYLWHDKSAFWFIIGWLTGATCIEQQLLWTCFLMFCCCQKELDSCLAI